LPADLGAQEMVWPRSPPAPQRQYQYPTSPPTVNYPALTPEAIRAALAPAAGLSHEPILSLPT